MSLLRLGNIEGIRSWRALQAEVTHPKQLPDGLLEAHFADRAEPDLFLVEVSTYPEPRVHEQLARGAAMVWLDRRELPEVLCTILHPRGNVQVDTEHQLHSRHGLTSLRVGWRLVELWKLPAEQLLATNDVGLIPLVPLTQFAGSPDVLLKECRSRIDAQAPPTQHDNLLAVTQVMTELRYNNPALLAFLGGKRAMIDSPMIREIVAEATAENTRKSILRVLKARFGAIPNDIALALEKIQVEAKLDELIALAASCSSLDEFRSKLCLE